MKINTNITIFGGTGDLTFRKLLPALYMMFVTDNFPKHSRIVIIGRREYSDVDYHLKAREWINKFARLPFDDAKFNLFKARISYFQMDFTNPEAYQDLATYFGNDEITNHLFYLAVAPRFFEVIADNLSSIEGMGQAKVIIEKPFGETLTLAKQLNQKLEKTFTPQNIYRIDHYLGKEMVRNIQTLRFANPIFANSWNHEAIAAVQISALEDVGVESRGGYYDQAGALKDMVQNHLFQVLSIIGMEQPASFQVEDVHEAQLTLLKQLEPIKEEDLNNSLVLGQYRGYLAEDKVKPDSKTETFVCMKLKINNERWQDVPFYIRTGKKTGVRETQIAISFKQLLPNADPDVLLIKIQPDEGINLRFNIKQPGDSEAIIPVKMDFCQSCNIEFHTNTPEAYERLFIACLNGDQSMFSQWEQIEVSWDYINKINDLITSRQLTPLPYEPNETGPQEANEMLECCGYKWLD